jgi:hypothetical protein
MYVVVNKYFSNGQISLNLVTLHHLLLPPGELLLELSLLAGHLIEGLSALVQLESIQ